MEIHQEAAKQLNVSEGDRVAVESMRGRVELKAKITTDTDPRVLYLQHGWDVANANELTDNLALDPVTGFPPYRSLLVRVIKVS